LVIGEEEVSTPEERYSYHVLVIHRPTMNGLMQSDFKDDLTLGQLHFYDKRAVIENASFCADKQGLGIAKRRKRSLVGQEMLLGLAQLAHNMMIWMRDQLSPIIPEVGEYGIKCWVRDWFGMGGRITFKGGQIVKIFMPARHEVARRFNQALCHWAKQIGIKLVLR
jgi:hypothetical protein